MGPNCVAAQQAETAFVGRKFKISHTSQTSGHFRNNFAPSQLNKLRLARSGWCEHSCRKRQFSKSLIFPITYYTNRVFWRFFSFTLDNIIIIAAIICSFSTNSKLHFDQKLLCLSFSWLTFLMNRFYIVSMIFFLNVFFKICCLFEFVLLKQMQN